MKKVKIDTRTFIFKDTHNAPSMPVIKQVFGQLPKNDIPVEFETKKQYATEYALAQQKPNKKFSKKQVNEFVHQEVKRMKPVVSRYTTNHNKFAKPKIVIFTDKPISKTKLLQEATHETAHVLYEQQPKLRKVWRNKTNPNTSPTEYGTTNSSEDFAESYTLAKLGKGNITNDYTSLNEVEKRLAIINGDVTSENLSVLGRLTDQSTVAKYNEFDSPMINLKRKIAKQQDLKKTRENIEAEYHSSGYHKKLTQQQDKKNSDYVPISQQEAESIASEHENIFDNMSDEEISEMLQNQTDMMQSLPEQEQWKVLKQQEYIMQQLSTEQKMRIRKAMSEKLANKPIEFKPTGVMKRYMKGERPESEMFAFSDKQWQESLDRDLRNKLYNQTVDLTAAAGARRDYKKYLKTPDAVIIPDEIAQRQQEYKLKNIKNTLITVPLSETNLEAPPEYQSVFEANKLTNTPIKIASDKAIAEAKPVISDATKIHIISDNTAQNNVVTDLIKNKGIEIANPEETRAIEQVVKETPEVLDELQLEKVDLAKVKSTQSALQSSNLLYQPIARPEEDIKYFMSDITKEPINIAPPELRNIPYNIPYSKQEALRAYAESQEDLEHSKSPDYSKEKMTDEALSATLQKKNKVENLLNPNYISDYKTPKYSDTASMRKTRAKQVTENYDLFKKYLKEKDIQDYYKKYNKENASDGYVTNTPQEQKTQEIFEEVLNRNMVKEIPAKIPAIIKSTPASSISNEIVTSLARENRGHKISGRFLPSEKQDLFAEEYLKHKEQENKPIDLKILPEKYLTEEMILANAENRGMTLYHVPMKLRTPTVTQKFIDLKKVRLSTIPKEQLTPELAEKLIVSNKGTISDLPVKMQEDNPELIKRLIIDDPHSIRKVTKTAINHDLVKTAIQNINYMMQGHLNNVPDEIINDHEILEEFQRGFDEKRMSYEALPNVLKNEKNTMIAIARRNLNNIKDVPQHLITNPEINQLFKKVYQESLTFDEFKNLPKEYQTKELTDIVFFNLKYKDIQKVPENMQSNILKERLVASSFIEDLPNIPEQYKIPYLMKRIVKNTVDRTSDYDDDEDDDTKTSEYFKQFLSEKEMQEYVFPFIKQRKLKLNYNLSDQYYNEPTKNLLLKIEEEALQKGLDIPNTKNYTILRSLNYVPNNYNLSNLNTYMQKQDKETLTYDEVKQTSLINKQEIKQIFNRSGGKPISVIDIEKYDNELIKQGEQKVKEEIFSHNYGYGARREQFVYEISAPPNQFNDLKKEITNDDQKVRDYKNYSGHPRSFYNDAVPLSWIRAVPENQDTVKVIEIQSDLDSIGIPKKELINIEKRNLQEFIKYIRNYTPYKKIQLAPYQGEQFLPEVYQYMPSRLGFKKNEKGQIIKDLTSSDMQRKTPEHLRKYQSERYFAIKELNRQKNLSPDELINEITQEMQQEDENKIMLKKIDEADKNLDNVEGITKEQKRIVRELFSNKKQEIENYEKNKQIISKLKFRKQQLSYDTTSEPSKDETSENMGIAIFTGGKVYERDAYKTDKPEHYFQEGRIKIGLSGGHSGLEQKEKIQYEQGKVFNDPVKIRWGADLLNKENIDKASISPGKIGHDIIEVSTTSKGDFIKRIVGDKPMLNKEGKELTTSGTYNENLHAMADYMKAKGFSDDAKLRAELGNYYEDDVELGKLGQFTSYKPSGPAPDKPFEPSGPAPDKPFKPSYDTTNKRC
jgi:hypothetical protein